jgi:hypothetical protein
MILTQCAVCATELGLSLGKKCGRCSTRYCGAACQVQHWKEGGHDKLCRKIKKSGGAERYNADQRYAKAVVVAAEACADDTKGQTCYICTQALHWKTKEGLVRGCSCRGTAGFAHVSCLAEQAKILHEEAKENHSDDLQGHRWHTCSLCKQDYHGVVLHALGWACWKTYLGRPETETVRRFAMQQLGIGLSAVERHEDALSVRTAELALLRRLGVSEHHILCTLSNLATSYGTLGQIEKALSIERDIYNGRLKLLGEEHPKTLITANNYATSMLDANRYAEAKSLMRKTMPVARRVIGEIDDLTLRMVGLYATALYLDAGATLDDLREAVTTLEEILPTVRQVFGGAHPFTGKFEGGLQEARVILSAREGDVEPLREAVAAMNAT